ncbi:hypothetical protein ACIGHJ_07250 [Stutzerimonas kunmingensis]|uniref:hypothetical protein n=1 Tax=Stutzerimonas kunmingensis TaxID=1211807 RepID=UPI00052E1165|nr:hypothetical protein [Stutzerimonas kunmingensis]CEG51392.1 conserved hypothetical protein [Stutzerimonas xanthomarina]
MSELSIALVAEGDTDLVIIEAALRAILEQPFTLTQLQPEATRPKMGTGWCGVLKWCDASAQRHSDCLDSDPTLARFDLLIIHLDVDVASESYANAGDTVQKMAQEKNWHVLPCAQPCPPVIDSVVPLKAALDSWLRPASRGTKTVLCLPAQASGTWLAAASLPNGHALLTGAECNINVESRLSGLPMDLRIRKKVREYREHAPNVTRNWPVVKAVCSQALDFESAVLAAI